MQIPRWLRNVGVNLGGGAPNLIDPTPLRRHDGAGYRWRRVEAPLVVDGAEARDVRQGSIADCNVAASLAGIAHFRPAAINAMVKVVQTPDREGEHRTFEVKFFPPGVDDPEQRITREVDDDFLAERDGDLVYGSWNERPELWFPVIEKAYGEWQDSLDGSVDRDGYRLLNRGGNAFGLFRALLGAKPVNYTVNELGEDQLLMILGESAQQRWPMVVFTYGEDMASMYRGTRLKEWHTYSILGVDRDARTVKLYNPWGETEYGNDGRDDGLFDMPIADFMTYFRNMNIARDPQI